VPSYRQTGLIFPLCVALAIGCLVKPSSAQTKAFIYCGSNQRVGLWAEPEFKTLVAELKCNEEVTILEPTSGYTGLHRIMTKKRLQGVVLDSHLSTVKEKRTSKTGKVLSGILVGMALGAAAAAAGAGTQSTASSLASEKIMLFGGEGHRTYLGCLNCSTFDNDSVQNQFGDFGSKYSSTSIFNRFGDFGSRYSNFSACNPYASDPPVIVDGAGRYYGRLTLNKYHSEIGAGSSYLASLAAICNP
jgi:hypothetical protein